MQFMHLQYDIRAELQLMIIFITNDVDEMPHSPNRSLEIASFVQLTVQTPNEW